MVARRSKRKKVVKPKKTLSENRSYGHPYATRSKDCREVFSAIALKETSAHSERSSDSSVICLGSFRKVPPLVNLEDGGDVLNTPSVEQSEVWATPKKEEIVSQ
ncbi:hypothetical protein KM043_009159 [Ampulex compressa]|nr:hypothetical protein KM043_009159 [Ampulex compressa]